MVDVTVITPIAPHHIELSARARESVHAQTVPCELLTMVDADCHGPAFIRNHLLHQVTTDFVVFLDADDWMQPAFVESMLSVWRQGHYVYTDWYEDSNVHHAPTENAWTGNLWHIVTCLLPTQAVRQVGGFDESLPGGEDTDFFWRFTRTGYRGIHLPEPLTHYSSSGLRARTFVNRSDFDDIMQRIVNRYNRLGYSMEPEKIQSTDVLAVATWRGNRVERGRATGRKYPRTGNNKTVWVDPSDIDASGGLFVAVNPHRNVVTDIRDIAAAMFPHLPPPIKYQAIAQPSVEAKPDFARLTSLYRESVV